MSETDIVLVVNGEEVRRRVDGRTSLADFLRDELRLTGTHLGCEQGVCGACTVLVDELPVRACLSLAVGADGAEIVTVEGLAGPDVDRLREHFSSEGALQCGFCTPGMLVTAYDMVRQRCDLDRASICAGLAGNICRCTGYNGIVRAVDRANQDGIQAEREAADLDGAGRSS